MTSLFAVGLTLAAVLAIIILIARYHLNPFIVLMSVSIAVALIAGMPPTQVIQSFEQGMGKVLGHVAIVIALGTMLGKMLAESGGADQIALTIVRLCGEKRISWGMMVIGLLVGLPVFFEVGFVLLIPLCFVLSKKFNAPLLMAALPMGASLSVVHGMLPPHPAAMLAVQSYNADIGLTILYGLIVGIPTAAIAGPLYTKFIVNKVHPSENNPLATQFTSREERTDLPPFSITIATIMAPIILMLIGSAADTLSPKGSTFNQALHFIGNTDMALLIATIMSFYTLGIARGFSRQTILTFTNECLAPTALIILLVGAGGGFGRELVDSGVSKVITDLAVMAHIPLLFLAWLIAAIVRVAAGSATVAMTTSASIIGPILMQTHAASPELMVLVTGAGSVAFGPLNDAGFWQIKEYLGMTVGDTMKTWSVIETLIAVFGLFFAFLLSFAL
ncbi:GntT/GntP/DsdX family permease [Entomobacter blattae]|uniref:High-affinity gluconate transporter n=1 Tax=Entomobacter blattae TaxID=2762277 RepID=A0A7H1NPL6_9PROT|nr:gluconate:H+ symporter [Entomobacter blattae]QNT77726.1 High-affinity gluconate transporter [Entomobacter blattae]